MEQLGNIKTYNKVYGNVGERLACEFLQGLGYEILNKNYKNFLGEIDIICKDNKDKSNPIYIFVEVKFRNSKKFGLPREAITFKKQQTIKKVATYYLKSKNLLNTVSVRFDCVEIIGGENGKESKIELIQNIF